MGQQSEYHVVTMPLLVNGREAAILRQRLRVRGTLRNATLQTLLERIEALRSDPRWSKANSSAEYRALKDAYGVSKRESCNAAFAHWRASKWMPSVVDSRIALELGTEVWQQVSAWLHGTAGRPRFKSARKTDTAWGADNHAGLCLRGQRVVWRNKLTPRKNLALALAWGAEHPQWQKRAQDREIVRVGIRRLEVRGRERFFALLCLRGAPFRDPAYLASVTQGVVAIDAGPSQLAVVSGAGSELLSLAPSELLVERQAEAKRLRRRQRALERSQRAMNPDCFDERGRWKKGARATCRSKRYRRLARRQREQARAARARRRADETRLARRIVSEHGSTVAAEALDYRAWARSRYGRRVSFTAPGAAMARIAREAEQVGGEFVELPTAVLALSQRCLCGARAKKSLSQRLHHCAACGLGPLDRDLFSAFLAHLVASEGADLSEGTWNQAGTRRKAQALCAPGRAPSPARRSGGRQASVARLARKAERQTRGQGPRAQRRAGASRQAALTGERLAGLS